MPHTFTPNSNTTPDPAFGSDGAMTTPTNNGHANSAVTDTGPGVVQTKSCRWGFAAFPSHNAQSIVLKFSWDIPAGGADADNSGGGTASAEASFIVSVSTDGGSNFSDVFTRSVSVSGVDSQSLIGSGSETVNIPNPAALNLDQIKIRDRIRASATESGAGDADASVTASISNIRLEVALSGAPGGGMM